VRGGSWQSSHPSNAYGIRCGAGLHHAEFVGINIGGALTTAGIQIDNNGGPAAGGAPSEVVFQGCSGNHVGAGAQWSVPSQAGGVRWIACDINPTWTFSQLPTVGLNKGDQYFITDANTSTLGAAVTAGRGTTNGYVVWNGSNWTLMSK